MSLLTPLYALAALGILAPIIFHLVRKRPKDIQEFSSVLFLDSNPPKFSNRSHLDNIWLLLLRIAAFSLLAFAFTRPFWKNPIESGDQANVPVERLLLIDTSASMQREGVWEQAIAHAKKVIADSKPGDRVSIYSLDESLTAVFNAGQLKTGQSKNGQPSEQTSVSSNPLALAAIDTLKPTWLRSDIGKALTQATELIEQHKSDQSNSSEADISDSTHLSEINEVFLISDFPRDGTLENFQSGSWPENVSLVPLRCTPRQDGNAYANILPIDETSANTVSDQEVRVMLANSELSQTDRLSIRWLDADGKTILNTTSEHSVPPGQQQIVRIPIPVPTSNTNLKSVSSSWILELSGDSQPFDNRCYYSPAIATNIEVGFIDRVPPNAENSLWFFAKRVPLSRVFETVQWRLFEPSNALDSSDTKTIRWWVASDALTLPQASTLTPFLQGGGHLLWVWDHPEETVANQAADLHAVKRQILQSWFSDSINPKDAPPELEKLEITEAGTKSFALLENIQLNHPVFSSFADPKFNDFSKVRFWHHRVISNLDNSSWNVLARFDDGSPAMMERGIGKGKVTILTSGWQTNDSQLALSSKFVPILAGLFEQAYPSKRPPERFAGNAYIPGESENGLVTPSGRTHRFENTSPFQLNELGFYNIEDKMDAQVQSNGVASNTAEVPKQFLAVNIAKSEHRIDPLETEEFSRFGIRLETSNSREKNLDKTASAKRQSEELESKQQYWWWIILGVLVLTSFETLWGIQRVFFSDRNPTTDALA